MLSLNQKFKLIAYAAGIFISFTVYGVLQELIFRSSYKDEDTSQKFTFPVAFVAIQCIVSSLFAKGMTLTQDQPESEKLEKYYFIIALFNIIATVTSTTALQFVPYPFQIVAKSAKPIPVMLLAVLIGRKTFSAQKYFFVLMIVVGVGSFIFKENYEAKDGENYLKGSYLIAISLLMDGLTGAAQDRMRSVSKPTSIEFMLHINSWSSAMLISFMAITGEGRDLIDFARKYPVVIGHLSLTVLVGTVGNFFISSMISNFGSLPLSLVTTTRKFFTVLVSVAAFGNALSLRQWIATSVIFSALFLDALFLKKHIPKPNELKGNENQKESESVAVNSDKIQV